MQKGSPQAALAMRRSSAARRTVGLFALLAVLMCELLADPCGFPGTLAQVVELRAADVALALHLDRGDQRRVRLERALDALPARHLPYDERRVKAAVALRDDHALVGLDALALAFNHAHVDDDRVARSEL